MALFRLQPKYIPKHLLLRYCPLRKIRALASQLPNKFHMALYFHHRVLFFKLLLNPNIQVQKKEPKSLLNK